jgi:hypothetical protein
MLPNRWYFVQEFDIIESLDRIIEYLNPGRRRWQGDR